MTEIERLMAQGLTRYEALLKIKERVEKYQDWIRWELIKERAKMK